MKLKINIKKELDELLMFDIYGFRKALKSIKVTNTESFIENLIKRSDLLLDLLNRSFDLDDHEKIVLSCFLACNIPLTFSANIGDGANSRITGEKLNGETLNVQGMYDKKELLEFLENIILPKEIIFKTFELHQKIGKSESKFTYSNVI